MNMERPKVGIGVLVLHEGKVLLGKRKADNGIGTWAPPGGHLEFGETWETCARREVLEETGIHINNVRFFTATNDIHTDGLRHYITIWLQADFAGGEIENCEPDKCCGWEWLSWETIPEPRFKPLDTIMRQGYHPFAKRHDKLVRDRIVEIIQARGEAATFHTATPEEYQEYLKTKLVEEVQEYLHSESIEELADILEVIHSLTALQGTPREQLQLIQKEKRDERGGFEQRTILEETK